MRWPENGGVGDGLGMNAGVGVEAGVDMGMGVGVEIGVGGSVGTEQAPVANMASKIAHLMAASS